MELRPSASGRWTRCAGSPAYIESLDLPPEPTSPAAEEGTIAHNQAEEFLRDSTQGFPVTRPGDAAVATYTDHCLGLFRLPKREAYGVEDTIPIFYDPESTTGTVDFWVYQDGALHIRDLKYGRGVPVSPTSPQLIIYAASVMREYVLTPKVITLGIVQPRCPTVSRPVNVSTFTLDEFSLLLANISQAAEEILKGEQLDLTPGEDQCRFCPARAVCKARNEQIVAQFDPILPAPESLTPQDLVRLYLSTPTIMAYMRDVQSYVERRMHNNHDLPGLKMVEGRPGNRRWADEDAATRWLKRYLKTEAFQPRKLVSPAQAEKKLGELSPTKEKNFTALIERPTGKPVVASEDDERPALPTEQFNNLDK